MIQSRLSVFLAQVRVQRAEVAIAELEEVADEWTESPHRALAEKLFMNAFRASGTSRLAMNCDKSEDFSEVTLNLYMRSVLRVSTQRL